MMKVGTCGKSKRAIEQPVQRMKEEELVETGKLGRIRLVVWVVRFI